MDINFSKLQDDLIKFVQNAVRTQSCSGSEESLASLIQKTMKDLNYDEAIIDSTGNAVGRIGNGKTIIHFDGHMDTVQVHDGKNWKVPPFSGDIKDGAIFGRGSVDMKSGLCAAIYGAALAKKKGHLDGKTVYITGTVCEEYCDGESLKHFYKEFNLKPDCCIICEPSDNLIALGHKGKAQIRIVTHGVSAHGAAPEKGKNAVYEMSEIIKRVEQLNDKLCSGTENNGTIVLSDISCVNASLNAVPSECTIYLDRRLALGESIDKVKAEMDCLIKDKDAHWEIGTLHHTTWKGALLNYEPLHDPWKIGKDSKLAQALQRAYKNVSNKDACKFDFWDFSTNAVTPVSMGIPTIGFGPGEYKLAHMKDEHCSIQKIIEAFYVYAELIKEL